VSAEEEHGWIMERRSAPRYRAQRQAHLLVIVSITKDETDERLPELIGYTRDVSETGLSLMADSSSPDVYEQCQLDSLLQIKLSLPLGVAEMQAVVVRREWVDETDPAAGLSIGARITEISGQDQILYTQYLETLG
jgi:hypothetical protein